MTAMSSSSADIHEWSLDDVSNWLGACGLCRLIETFRDNGVGGRALLSVTKQDLKDELEITNYLDRKMLWKEIEAIQERGGAFNGSFCSSSEVDIDGESFGHSVSYLRAQSFDSTLTLTEVSSDASDWSTERHTRHNLRVSPHLVIEASELSIVTSRLKVLANGATVERFIKLSSQENGILELIMGTLLYGLIGKKMPTKDIARKEINQSAITMLRAYCVMPEEGMTILSTCNILRRLPQSLSKIVRDAIRVCEDVSPPRNRHTVLSDKDLGSLIQIFKLSDTINNLYTTNKKSITNNHIDPNNNKSSVVVPQQHNNCMSQTDVQQITEHISTSKDAASCIIITLLKRLLPQATPLSSLSDHLPRSAISLLRAYGLNNSATPGNLPTLDSCAESLIICKVLPRFVRDVAKALGIHTAEAFQSLLNPDSEKYIRQTKPKPPTKDFKPGDLIVISSNIDEAKVACESNKKIGWSLEMGAYIGKTGYVKRFFKDTDKVRILHEDDVIWTWPASCCKGVARPLALRKMTLNALSTSPAQIHTTPSLKSPIVSKVFPGSDITVAESKESWLRLHGGGWTPDSPYWAEDMPQPKSPPMLSLPSDSSTSVEVSLPSSPLI